MKVPGLEAPDVLQQYPLPWTLEEDFAGKKYRAANGLVIMSDVALRLRVLCEAAPELAAALVAVTQALVDELDDPGGRVVDPLQVPEVQQALAALAKARGGA